MGVRALCSMGASVPSFFLVAGTSLRSSGMVGRVPCRPSTLCVFSETCVSARRLAVVGAVGTFFIIHRGHHVSCAIVRSGRCGGPVAKIVTSRAVLFDKCGAQGRCSSPVEEVAFCSGRKGEAFIFCAGGSVLSTRSVTLTCGCH